MKITRGGNRIFRGGGEKFLRERLVNFAVQSNAGTMMNFRCLIANRWSIMRLLLLIMMMLAAGSVAADFEKINPEAERLYAEKSFARAQELFQAMDVAKLSA